MAEWHYSKNGKKAGPIPAQQLKAMADSGLLLPTDLIRKEGMAEWKPASNVKGLFPSVSVANVENPKASVAPAQTQSPPSVPKKTAKQSLVEAAKGAAQYTAKQAERTKLINLTLPPMYQALGRHVYSSSAFRAEFADLFQQLEQVQLDLSENRNKPTVEAKSIGDKAKAMAGQAMQSAQAQKLSLRQSSLFGTLGKVVYDKHQGSGGPPELVKPIADSLARLASLDGELNDLLGRSNAKWITPKKTLASIGLISLATVLTLYFFSGRGNNSNISLLNPRISTQSAMSNQLTESHFPFEDSERFFVLRRYTPKEYGEKQSPLKIAIEEKTSKWLDLHPGDKRSTGEMWYVMFDKKKARRNLPSDGIPILYRKSTSGIFRCDSFGTAGGQKQLNYEVLELKWGANPGDKWSTTVAEKNCLFSCQYNRTENLGDIPCAVVTVMRSDNGKIGSRKRYWLAKDIGMVRYAEYGIVENMWRPTVERIYSELESEIPLLDWESE